MLTVDMPSSILMYTESQTTHSTQYTGLILSTLYGYIIYVIELNAILYLVYLYMYTPVFFYCDLYVMSSENL